MTFITSDTHFGHKLVAISRGFSSATEKENVTADEIENMNNTLIHNWNSIITEKDTIYHLGDVCFQMATYYDAIMPLLKGKKILILGNHEHKDMSRYIKYFSEIYSTAERCFHFKNGKRNVILSHIPIHESQMSARFSDYLNLHGHIHASADESYYIKDKRYFNVNCEFHNLMPININEMEL